MNKLSWILALGILGSLAFAQACSHPYFPVAEGRTWQYRSTEPGSSDYTVSILQVSAKGFVQRMTFGKSSFDLRWDCTASGLVQLDFLSIGGPENQGAEIKTKTLKSSGVVFPPANLAVPGTSWAYSYVVEQEIKSGDTTIISTSTVEVQNKIVALEEVTVPAGTFSALRVDSTSIIKGTMKAAGQSIPMNNTVQTSSWYAKDVGMVKSTAAGYTTELVSYKR